MKDPGSFFSRYDSFTIDQLEAAAEDVLQELDDIEIWAAPGVHDAVLRYFSAQSVDDDPRGEAFAWLTIAELLEIPEVRDLCLQDILDSGAAERRAEQIQRWQEDMFENPRNKNWKH